MVLIASGRKIQREVVFLIGTYPGVCAVACHRGSVPDRRIRSATTPRRKRSFHQITVIKLLESVVKIVVVWADIEKSKTSGCVKN